MMVTLSSLIDYMLSTVFPVLNDVVIAIFTFFLGLIVGRVAGKFVYRILHSFDVDKTLFKMIGAKVSIEGLVELLISYIVYAIFFVIALNFLGVTSWVLYLAAILVLVFVALASFLSLRDFLPNVFAGIVLSRRGFPRVGDRVRIDTIQGKVVGFNPVETRVMTDKGDLIAFPNRRLLGPTLQKMNTKDLSSKKRI